MSYNIPISSMFHVYQSPVLCMGGLAAGDGLTEPNSTFFNYILFSQPSKQFYLLHFTSIFSRCRRSWVAAIAAKYECASTDLTDAKAGMSLTDKLKNWTWVTLPWTNVFIQHSTLYLPSFTIHIGSSWVCFLSFARSKLRLCSANHRPGYWSNLPCDWPSTAWAYSVCFWNFYPQSKNDELTFYQYLVKGFY